MVYSEIIREKIYISLKMLKNYYTIKYINSNGINLDNLTHIEYENILKAITEYFKKEYKQVCDVLGKYILSHYENISKHELNSLFFTQTSISFTAKIWYYDYNESTYQQLFNERFSSVKDKAFARFTRVVGSKASNIKFKWEGFTSFLLGHNNPLFLHETRSPYFHKPVVVTIGADLYQPKKYYSDDEKSILSKIPRYRYNKKKMYYSHEPEPVLNGINITDYVSSDLD